MKTVITIRVREREYAINAILLGILFLGLIFKGMYLYSYAINSPYFSFVRKDSAVYLNWAKLISQEGWRGTEIFYWAPFYPYFLSITFSILTKKLLGVYILQLAMGICSVGLIYLIAKRVFNERAGLMAAGLSLAYAPLTFFETKILAPVPSIFLGLVFMYLLTKAEQEKKLLYWFGGAAALGFAIICRPNYILVIPFTILGLLLIQRKQLRQRYVPILILAVIPSLVIGTVTLRNYAVGKDFVPISANAGITFAQGNNPRARGSMSILPEFSGQAMNQRHEETRIAERVVGRKLKPSEVNKFWFTWGLTFIRENPGQYLRLLLNKATLIFSNLELGSNYLLGVDEAVTPCLRLAFVPFGFIMSWTVIGLASILIERRSALILLSTFGGTFSMLLLFYVNTRYRMALVPPAVIMAGGGLDYLLRNMRKATVILAVVVTISILSLPSFGPLDKTTISRAESGYWAYLGIAYKSINSLEKALWSYENAIAIYPNNYRHYLEKIELLGALHSNEARFSHLVKDLDDKDIPMKYRHLILAKLYYTIGNDQEAEKNIQQIFTANMKDEQILIELGMLYGRIGKHDAAMVMFRRGLELNPHNVNLQYNYALACFMAGNYKEADRWTKSILINSPHYDKARFLLNQIHGQQ